MSLSVVYCVQYIHLRMEGKREEDTRGQRVMAAINPSKGQNRVRRRSALSHQCVFNCLVLAFCAAQGPLCRVDGKVGYCA